jgi:multidrug resistance protein
VAAISAAIFADSLLYSAVVPVLPAYAEQHGASPMAIGVLFASYAVALLATTPFVGLLSDRIGHRTPVVGGMVGITLATLAYSIADSYPTLLAARTLQGAAAAAVWTSGVALVAERVDPSAHGSAMGVVLASMSAGLLVGPPLTGLLVEAYGFRTPFVLLATAAGLCCLVQLLVGGGSGRATAAQGSVRALLASREFRRTIVTVVVAAAALSMLEPLLPLDLAARLGADTAVIGFVFGAATLAHLVASPVVGLLSDRVHRPLLMTLGLVAMAVTIPFAGSRGSVLGAVGVLVAFAAAYSLVLVPALPEIAAHARRSGGGYATAYGAFNIAYAAGMVAGPSAGSALAGAVSLTGVLVTAGAVLALTAVLVGRGAARPSPSGRRPGGPPILINADRTE